MNYHAFQRHLRKNLGYCLKTCSPTTIGEEQLGERCNTCHRSSISSCNLCNWIIQAQRQNQGQGMNQSLWRLIQTLSFMSELLKAHTPHTHTETIAFWKLGILGCSLPLHLPQRQPRGLQPTRGRANTYTNMNTYQVLHWVFLG